MTSTFGLGRARDLSPPPGRKIIFINMFRLLKGEFGSTSTLSVISFSAAEGVGGGPPDLAFFGTRLNSGGVSEVKNTGTIVDSSSYPSDCGVTVRIEA